jgi:hypothetical protein
MSAGSDTGRRQSLIARAWTISAPLRRKLETHPMRVTIDLLGAVVHGPYPFCNYGGASPSSNVLVKGWRCERNLW